MNDDFHFLNNFLIIATDAGQCDGSELTKGHEAYFSCEFLESRNLSVFLKLVLRHIY